MLKGIALLKGKDQVTISHQLAFAIIICYYLCINRHNNKSSEYHKWFFFLPVVEYFIDSLGKFHFTDMISSLSCFNRFAYSLNAHFYLCLNDQKLPFL